MDEYGAYSDAWQPDHETAIRYGCVRINPGILVEHSTGWLTTPGLYLYTNSAHVACGITDVKINESTGDLHVVTDGAQNGVPIVSGDETAALNRIWFGGSGGNGVINIRAYKEGYGRVRFNVQADYDVVADPLLNLWLLFVAPLVRGSGATSKADAALAALALLEARVTALEGN